MAAIIAAIVASAGGGVWAERRYGAAADRFSRRSLLFVLWAVLPPVTFLNLVDADLDSDAGIGILLSLVSLVLLGGVAWAMGTRLLRLPRPATGAVISTVIVMNTGYLGYPVVAALLGFDELSEAVAYDILVSGPALLVGSFAAGAAFGDAAGETAGDRVRSFFTRNPALFAAGLGLAAPSALAPELLVDISRWVVIGVLPLGFFAVGVALAATADEGRSPLWPRADSAIATAVALRLIGGPLILLALAAPLIDLPPTYLLLAAMPCGLNSMIVGHAYGLDLRVAAGAITWSTAIAVVWLSAYGLLA